MRSAAGFLIVRTIRRSLSVRLHRLFFVLDLPVDQEGERCPQRDDRSKDPELRPLADHNRSENLAAKLELQCKRDALRQKQADLSRLCDPSDECPDGGIHEYDDPEQFQKESRDLDDEVKDLVQILNDRIHILEFS